MSHRMLKLLPLLALLALLVPFAGCADTQHNIYGVVPRNVPPIAPPGAYLYKVFMLSAQEGWATGATFDTKGAPQKAMLAHYTGGSWTEVPVSTPLFSLYLTSPTNGWAVGLHGAIMHYDGTSWTAVASPTTAILRDVVLDSANDGWAVGEGVILHYDGQHWVLAQPGPLLLGLSLSAPGEGWAVGEIGALYHLSGGQWTAVQSSTTEDLSGVFMVSATEGWAVGANDTLLHYAGGVWSYVQSPVSTSWYSVSLSSATEGWASGEDGVMMHYQAGQWTSSKRDSATGYDLSSVAMVSADEGWAVGQKNIVRHYLNGAWTTYGFLP